MLIYSCSILLVRIMLTFFLYCIKMQHFRRYNKWRLKSKGMYAQCRLISDRFRQYSKMQCMTRYWGINRSCVQVLGSKVRCAIHHHGKSEILICFLKCVLEYQGFFYFFFFFLIPLTFNQAIGLVVVFACWLFYFSVALLVKPTFPQHAWFDRNR